MRSGVISSIFNLQSSSTEPRSIFEISSDFYNCKQSYVADDSGTSSHLYQHHHRYFLVPYEILYLHTASLINTLRWDYRTS